MNDEFLKKWRSVYKKMIEEAMKKLLQEDQKYVKSYIIEKNEKSVLMKFGRWLNKVTLKYDEEKQKQSDERMINIDLNNHVIVNCTLDKLAKDNPDQAGLYSGLSYLYLGLDFMHSAAGICNKYALLNMLKYFCEIYNANPDIKDVDALIQFMKKDKVMNNFDEIDMLPQEIRDNLDLGLDENLREFVEQYAKEYIKDDVSLGGKSL